MKSSENPNQIYYNPEQGESSIRTHSNIDSNQAFLAHLKKEKSSAKKLKIFLILVLVLIAFIGLANIILAWINKKGTFKKRYIRPRSVQKKPQCMFCAQGNYFGEKSNKHKLYAVGHF